MYIQCKEHKNGGIMKIREIMTANVFTLSSDRHADLAEDVMNWQRIRHIPIVNGAEMLVGLVTHRDILSATIRAVQQYDETSRESLRHVPIESIMQKKVITVAPDTDVREAASMMIDKKIGCLPVVQNDKLVGIVTEADFLKLASEVLP